MRRPKRRTTPRPAPAPSSAPLEAALVEIDGAGAGDAIRRAGDRAPALLDAWRSSGNAEALVEVAESGSTPAPLRKLARRALQVLRSRGVTIPTRTRVARPAGEEPAGEFEAFFMPSDAAGHSLYSFSRREPGGRHRIVEFLVAEEGGILRANLGWSSGSRIRAGYASMRERTGVTPQPVPFAWARHRIDEALRRLERGAEVPPLGLDTALAAIGAPPSAPPPHPAGDLEVSELEMAASVGASLDLHREPEIQGWLPPPAAVQEMLAKLGERIDPELSADRERVTAALREEMEAATDRYFQPEVRARVVQRLRDAAICVRARVGERRGREVLAVAAAVSRAGLITSPPREIPFLLGYFEKAVAMLAAQGRGQLKIPVTPKPLT